MYLEMNRDNLAKVTKIYCRVSDMAVSLSAEQTAINVHSLRYQGNDDRRLLRNSTRTYDFAYQLLCAESGKKPTIGQDEEIKRYVDDELKRREISTEMNLSTEYQLPARFEIIVAILQNITGKKFDKLHDKGDGDWLLCAD